MILGLFTGCEKDKEVIPEVIGKWKYAAKATEVVETSSTEADALIKDYLAKKENRFQELEVDEDGLVLGDDVFVGTVAVYGDLEVINFLGELNYSRFKVYGNVLSIWVDVTKDVENKRIDLGIDSKVKISQVVVREEYISM